MVCIGRFSGLVRYHFSSLWGVWCVVRMSVVCIVCVWCVCACMMCVCMVCVRACVRACLCVSVCLGEKACERELTYPHSHTPFSHAGVVLDGRCGTLIEDMTSVT